MTPYLVFEAPGGPDRDHRNTRFIADRFSWLAFVLPWIWFARHGLFGLATALVVAQLCAFQLAQIDGFGAAGLLFALAVCLVAGFEGRTLLQRRLAARGWTLTDIVLAPDLSTAEAMYFARLAETASPSLPMARPEWKTRATPYGFMANDPAGSFQFDLNGRR